MGGFVTMKRPNAEKLFYIIISWASIVLMMFEGRHCKFFCKILICCKFVHFNQNYSEIFTYFAENFPLIKDEGGKLLV